MKVRGAKKLSKDNEDERIGLNESMYNINNISFQKLNPKEDWNIKQAKDGKTKDNEETGKTQSIYKGR